VLSPESISDPDLSARRTLATVTDEEMLLPVIAMPIDRSNLESKTQQIEAVSFAESWGQGLSSLFEVLVASGCPRTTSAPTITTRSFVQEDLITAGSEVLVSNRFEIPEVPSVIRRFVSEKPINDEAGKAMNQVWAFRKVDTKRFLSFWSPPESQKTENGIKEAGGSAWESVRDIDGIATRNLVSELIKKSLHVKCVDKGLIYCQERNLLYFPEGLVPSNRLYFTKQDGTRTFVGAMGKRTYWRPGVSELYKHQLAPVFSVGVHAACDYTVLVRIRVRLTDEHDNVLSKQKGLSRRKHLCRNWWNDDWLHRVMAVMQFLSTDDESIVLEEGDNRLVVATNPDQWEVGVCLNEAAVKDVDETHEDALGYDEDGTDEEEENDNSK